MRFKLLLSATLMLAAGVAQSADPQPYVVHFSTTGNAALMATVRASSQLETLRSNAPVGPFALIDRADEDAQRLGTVLGSFGYYRPTVTITIDGLALDDTGLAEQLTALPKSEPAKVEVRIEPGVLFRVRNVTLEGMVDEAARKAMNLNSGAAAIASEVLAARDRLQTALQEEGHAYARVEQPVAYLDANEPLVDIRIKADPGPVYKFGPVKIDGLKRTKPSFAQREVTIRAGELYRSSIVEQTRSNLLGLGVFAAVTVRLPSQSAVAADGQLPITFVVVEQALHTVTLNAAYSSDLGASAGATWTHHNLLGHAEQLAVRASVINAGCTTCDGLGYDTGATLTKPDFLQNDQSLVVGLSALRQYLIAYNQIAESSSVALTRKLSSLWTVSAGAMLEQEQVQQEQFDCPKASYTEGTIDPTQNPSMAPWCHYTLLSFPITGRYDSTGLADPLNEATHGIRLAMFVTPTHSLFGAAHPTFLIAQATASTYFDLAKLHWSQAGRSIIALRGTVAEAVGASQFSLPPDQRLYAGGSTTVRGYAYQSIGPQFPNGNPTGGTSLVAGTFELRQRLVGHYGMAAFVDAGQVTARGFSGVSIPTSGGESMQYPARSAFCTKHGEEVEPPPLQPQYSVGYGLGLRYFTPVGPIRFDVAAPGNPTPCTNTFEVYIGLGEAF